MGNLHVLGVHKLTVNEQQRVVGGRHVRFNVPGIYGAVASALLEFFDGFREGFESARDSVGG